MDSDDDDINALLLVPSLAERLQVRQSNPRDILSVVPTLSRKNKNPDDILVISDDEIKCGDTLSLQEYEKTMYASGQTQGSERQTKQVLPRKGTSDDECEFEIVHAISGRPIVSDPDKSSFRQSSSATLPPIRQGSSDLNLGRHSGFRPSLPNSTSSICGKSPKKVKQNLEEKERLKQEKLQEKANKQAEKEMEKVIKCAEKAVKKALKPGENLKYVSAFIDPELISVWKNGDSIIQELNEAKISYKLQSNLVPSSVVWERKSVEHLISVGGKVIEKVTPNHEDHVILIVHYPELLLKISGSVAEFAGELRNLFHGKKVNLFITGMAAYYRSKKSAADRNFRQIVREEVASQPKRKKKDAAPFVSREEVEDLLVELDVSHGVSHVHVESAKEFANFVITFTKSIADREYKLNERQESFTFYSESDMQLDIPSVKVDAAGNGLSRVWTNQIRALPNVGLDTAQAIAAVYPLPKALKMAYENCSSTSQAQLLLQDIVVRRGAGALTSTRRVGPELSRKMHLFFTTSDGNLTL